MIKLFYKFLHILNVLSVFPVFFNFTVHLLLSHLKMERETREKNLREKGNFKIQNLNHTNHPWNPRSEDRKVGNKYSAS